MQKCDNHAGKIEYDEVVYLDCPLCKTKAELEELEGISDTLEDVEKELKSVEEELEKVTEGRDYWREQALKE
jgi:uncharacterized protein (DUF3084 family)